MTLLLLTTLLACDSAQDAAKGVTSDVREAAAKGADAARGAASKASAAVSGLPNDDDGLAAGCPDPIDSVDLEEARLGMAVPNAIKGMTVQWDGKRNLLWHAAIFSPYLIGHDPETGKPAQVIDMEVSGFNPNKLWLDASRDRMVFLSASDEMIRAVDLQAGKLTHKIDVKAQGSRSYPTEAADLDVATGRLWVWNANSRQLNGYSFDGADKTPITGMSNVMDISAAPSGGKLAVLDSTSKEASRVVVIDTQTGQSRVVCQFSSQPPNRVVMFDDGSVVLGDKQVRKVDASCKEQWTATLPEAPQRWELEGDYLVATMERGGVAEGGIGSRVAILEPRTGRLKALVNPRWETKSISLDIDGRRVFVGNGGDGSATVFSLPDGQSARTIQLASSADDVVVDPKTGDRYILSRLGGSRIYRWKEDGSFDLFTDQAPWPFQLAVDGEQRTLLAPSFFEARLYIWPLQGGAGKTVDLGIPGSTGDTIGDFAYDPESGLAAVVLPEEGWVSVVDVKKNKTVFTRQFEELAAGHHAGPGAGTVAIANNSVYVGATRKSMIWRLDARTGKTLAEATVKGLAGDSSAAGGAT